MNFRPRNREEPEINLIPFIDVLLVILIFLMLSTTYSQFTELQLKLPLANVDAPRQHPREVRVAVSADGQYRINQATVSSVADLTQALQSAAQAREDAVLVIHADAAARHQAVVSVLEAARSAGLTRITFATQASAPGATP